MVGRHNSSKAQRLADVAESLTWWPSLGPERQGRLLELASRFEKKTSFEGVRGFEPTPDMVSAISLQACLLILGLDLDWYRDVSAVVIAPHVQTSGAGRSIDGGVRSDAPVHLSGQAMLHGPVLIVWDVADDNARHPERGFNVVFHEFAHKIDMRSGSADGEPPMERHLAGRWHAQVQRLLAMMRDRPDPVLDGYAALNPAELLAVATEAFFTIPDAVRRAHPELYSALTEFYRQDPAAWMPAPAGA